MNDSTISAGPANHGIRSTPAIRWLLLAGALVSGVSVYRLVQGQWTAIPKEFQFLILVSGALAIFGLGALTRRRLHLPYAGSALLFLFTGLVPVLAWGAVELALFEAFSGWIAYGAGAAALLGAAVSVLRSELRYRGWIYPAALGGLLAAQPVLPWLNARMAESQEIFYATAAFLLGAVLYIGSRHANRFSFHRDRMDGKDRPIHLVPFLLLGVLYAGSLILLDRDFKSAFLALPVAVLGAVLISTGEEYYRALARSLGKAPERWPQRSVALLAPGFALIVTAVLLSRGSSSCLAMTAVMAAGLFLRWSLRYSTASTHVLGVAAAAVAWHTFPALLGGTLADPLDLGWSHLGFLAGLTVFGAVMARLQILEKLRRTHGILTGLYLLGITILGLFSPLLLAAALGITVAGLPFLRRIEPVKVAVFTLAVLTWTGSHELGFAPAACISGSAILALVLASRFLEGGLARLTGASIEAARRALLGPAVAVGSLLATHLFFLPRFASTIPPRIGLEVALAGAIWMAAGFRLRSPLGFTAGGLMLSLGLHFFLALETNGFNPWLVLLTLSLAVLSWLAARESSGNGRLDTAFNPGARMLTFLHGALGVIWLIYAPVHDVGLTVEPLILLLLGLALLRDGLATRDHEEVDLGLVLAVAWVPLQILGNGWLRLWTTALPVGLTLAGAILMMLIAMARRAPGLRLARIYGLPDDEWSGFVGVSLSGLARCWRVLAVAACLLLAGWAPLVLAMTLIAVEIVARREIQGLSLRDTFPARLSLLPLLQLVLLIVDGGQENWVLEAIFAVDFLPVAAALALAWSLGIRALGKQEALRRWSFALQGGTAGGLWLAFLISLLTKHPFYADWRSGVLIAVAAGWSALSIHDGLRRREPRDGWSAQIWVGLAVLQGFTAGWLHLGSGIAPYVLLSLGTAEYAAGALLARSDRGGSLAASCRWIGLVLPVVAGSVALFRVNGDVWLSALPVFLTSLFYTVTASREPRRVLPALASAGFLGMALLSVILRTEPGPEFYSLAPGLALFSLAWLLRTELGPAWSRHLAAAGAACVYATPIIALSSQISWAWLAVLLVLTVSFGAASFALRSRSLLTVSTAAMLTDLGFFVFRIGTTAPMALWVLGLGFGLALMATAAWLEYQREGVLQQIRVFGRELRAWS